MVGGYENPMNLHVFMLFLKLKLKKKMNRFLNKIKLDKQKHEK